MVKVTDAVVLTEEPENILGYTFGKAPTLIEIKRAYEAANDPKEYNEYMQLFNEAKKHYNANK